MLKKLSFIFLIMSFFLVLSGELHARRGRSFGGRSFSRSFGRSSRSYGRRYRSYGYRRYGYRRYGYSRGGVFICGGGGLAIMGIVIAMIIIVVIIAIVKRGKGSSTPGMGTLIKLQVAFYANAQGDIRKQINGIGQKADTSSPGGLAQLLNSMMVFIGRHIEDVSHYHYECSKKIDVGMLENKFESLASSERMKYDDESFSNRDGKKSSSQTASGDDELEIQQHVVLTSVIATERVDFQEIAITDQHQFKDTVNKLAGISARSLYAVEFILTPSETTEGLSRETLELEFPELKVL